MIDTSAKAQEPVSSTQIPTASQAVRKQRKKAEQPKEEDEPDLQGIGYFHTPVLVEDLWSDNLQIKVAAVYAKGNYSYALERPEGSKTNQLYSWGMGENYVLGSREDDNQFRPYKVHPKMFDELPVMMVGAGTQHVVVLTSDSQDH